MNEKLSGDFSDDDTLSSELINPFVHHLELETTYEKIKVSIHYLIRKIFILINKYFINSYAFKVNQHSNF